MKKPLLLISIFIFSYSFAQNRYNQEDKSYENGKLKEYRITSGIEKTLKFKYNSNGLRTNSEIFSDNGSKLFEASKEYTDSKDLNQIWYNQSGGVIDKLTYKYDSDNRLNQIYNYFGDSNDYFITNYKYNGNQIISASSYFMIEGKKYDLSEIDDIISIF